MTTKERVGAIRRLMRKQGLAAYLVPSTDPHNSEYVPPCWQRRAWLSGFTGSAGDVVVTMREAGLWTDSRYFLQAAREMDGEVFKLFKMKMPGTPSIAAYLASCLRKGQVVGVDPQVVSKDRAEGLELALEPRQIKVRFLARNLVDQVWKDRPRLPAGPLVRHPDRFACEKVGLKLARLREDLKRLYADAYVVSATDEIAWLFNMRGADVEYNPVVISHAIIAARGASLFVDPAKVGPGVRGWMRSFLRLRPYGEMASALRDLGRKGKCVLVDPAVVNRWVLDRLKGARIVFAPSPVAKAKAVKNPAQIRGIQRAHVQDGVALTRFLHWLDELPGRQRCRVTETEAAARLAEFRAQGRHYRGQSFSPIAAWKANGAVVHYDPAKGINSRLSGRGLFLLDTGGHYLDGTTDVTRTVVLGKPQRREKLLFTRVLQGVIRLSSAVIPEGTTGGRLEVLARQPLWNERLDYGHGTGHGVGHYLGVHEGPVGFSTRNPGILEVGNVISVEPGCYQAGEFGIRTENLVTVMRAGEPPRKGKQGWLRFETLTLCLIDLDLIEPSLLEDEEIQWLNGYHARVRRMLSPHLEPPVRSWLKEATRPIGITA
ncbi:MAG: M24 family metallopeptidase [Candidatus Eisenbacteria sp.]|nr:M24 family metallopeptidase [Candidatus Eisenbacteria bacterium]